MHFSRDRTVHTTAFDKPVVDHGLERKIAQTAAGPTEKDRSDDRPLQIRARYRLSYIPLGYQEVIYTETILFFCLRKITCSHLRFGFQEITYKETNLRCGFQETTYKETNLRCGFQEITYKETNLRCGFQEITYKETNLRCGFQEITYKETNLLCGFQEIVYKETNLRCGFQEIIYKETNLRCGFQEIVYKETNFFFRKCHTDICDLDSRRSRKRKPFSFPEKWSINITNIPDDDKHFKLKTMFCL